METRERRERERTVNMAGSNVAVGANPASNGKYSCKTEAETLQWINAIVDFLRPFSFLVNAHVVNFFQDKLWETIDKEWIDCLRREPVRNLLLIPSGGIQEHWPNSLKELVLTLKSLALCREQEDIHTVLPGVHMTSLNSVLAQGMNPKKKHEVEVLSAMVSSLTNNVKAQMIVDVGAGQGYLSQVLCFHYQHSVLAIDASSHHGSITNARAERIRKYYAAQNRKSGSGPSSLNIPKTVTSRVLSSDMLKCLTDLSQHRDNSQQLKLGGEIHEGGLVCDVNNKISYALAGLHACGDLSATMLKTFVDGEDVKAIVSIGCCYNLLSEDGSCDAESPCGFPMSDAVKSSGLSLGKTARDLACQSAERWRSMDVHSGIQNFELHAFRAAFQMVLSEYYPEVVTDSLSIGRQGKALRRRQQKQVLESQSDLKEISFRSLSQHLPTTGQCRDHDNSDTDGMELKTGTSSIEISFEEGRYEETRFENKSSIFQKFCLSAFDHLGIEPSLELNINGIWKEAEPFAELVGPFWSLRAAFGPVLETLLLLDRLLFLQEQGSSVEAFLLPIFDPKLSPRNVALVAKKKTSCQGKDG